MEIGEIIRDLVEDFLASNNPYISTPQQINEGECGTFADIVCRAIPGAMRDKAPGHVFVYFEGRYYDSEAPDGVEHWTQLPFFTEERYGIMHVGVKSFLEEVRAAA